MTTWDAAQVELIELLPRAGRGPRREGVFALWLVLRVAQDLLLDPPLAERNVRRRLTGLERRLSSLTVTPPLKRALLGALAELRDRGAAAVPAVLANLVAPARETAGIEAGEAIQRAARAVRPQAPSR
ncbi:MAG TPA: hypothetical protein VMG41_05530 [Gemmatimonadales bacterium]|nr:hypothetical protein [Gemmatimonadales bacterium]